MNQIVARANCGFDHVACRWTFPYRSSDAGAAAEEIHGAIASCKSLISVESDESVNHPDTYRARIYDFPATTLVLSVKDKAARSETLVTLRTVAKN